ncbi:hypothetical protein HYT23_02180 [Candidatus Pacearchaeota archaeon]|nr:hypothetical protein [Candidatus Pacearchaeota archaeon]
MTRDLSLITQPYSEVLGILRMICEIDNSRFNYWFSDKKDDATALSETLKRDLEEYNPQELYLSGKPASTPGYCKDPWENEIIPCANRLSESEIEKAVIMLSTEKIPKGNEFMFLKELVRGIDEYIEKAGSNRRYSRILITPQNYLQIFYDNNEGTMPNWGGFKGRQDGILVLDRNK